MSKLSEEGDDAADLNDEEEAGANTQVKSSINDPYSIIPANIREAIMKMIDDEVSKGVESELKL